MLSPSFDKAVEHHRAGDFEKAIALYRHVLQTARGAEAARVGQMLGSALQQRGELEQAEEAVRTAIRAEPAPALNSRRALATMLASRARMSDAIGVWREAVEASGKLGPIPAGEARMGLAIQLAESRRPEEALKEIRQLATEFPNVSGVRYELGRLSERMGLLAEARTELMKVLELAKGAVEAEILLSRIDATEGKLGDAKNRLEGLMPRVAQEHRGILLMEIAHVLDKAGAYGPAFEAARNGQAMNFASLPQMARDGRPHEWVMGACLKIEKDAVAKWAKPVDGGKPADAPIFVVGFPRSGTTLVEQMLSTHPRLAVSDEMPLLGRVRERMFLRFRPRGEYPTDLGQFTADHIGQARRWYMELAENAVGAERLKGRRVVDKQPLNLIDVCFVRLLFPESPVVHVQRDPRDTVLSSFLQGYSRGVPHMFDLEATARIYGRFAEIWAHYKDVLGLKCAEVKYEELVAAPEQEARKLLEFVGEKWDEGVLRFHEPKHRRYITTPSYADVTRPAHAGAVGHWKQYQPQLAPVMPLLQPWVEKLGYK